MLFDDFVAAAGYNLPSTQREIELTPDEAVLALCRVWEQHAEYHTHARMLTMSRGIAGKTEPEKARHRQWKRDNPLATYVEINGEEEGDSLARIIESCRNQIEKTIEKIKTVDRYKEFAIRVSEEVPPLPEGYLKKLCDELGYDVQDPYAALRAPNHNALIQISHQVDELEQGLSLE